jgi:hypothetical protein
LFIKGGIWGIIVQNAVVRLDFTGKKKTNYYQIRKFVNFLKSLQSLSAVLQDFLEWSFRSITIFPYLEVTRKKSWHVELAIANKVYLYRYPFYFPKQFLTYDDTYDLRVKIFFLLFFSTIELEKEFPIKEFLDQFDISNSRIIRLIKSIVPTFQDAQDLKSIEGRFTLLTKTNLTKKVDKLTSNSVGRGKSIFYTEIP